MQTISNPEPLVGSATTTGLGERTTARMERLSESAHEAVNRAADTMSSAARELGAKGEKLMATQHLWTEKSRDTVRRHPIASVAIALAAGLVISRLSGRQHH